MKINDILYKTPEMTEEKLLEFINKHKRFLRKDTYKRLEELYNYSIPIEQILLAEWDVINEKKSYLSKSQRDEVCGLISTCLVLMTKNNE